MQSGKLKTGTPWRRAARDLGLGLALAFGLAACSDNGDSPGAQATPYAALSCSQPAGMGWCWQRPQPDGADVQDIYFLDALHGWAVGENGRTWRTEDSGASWQLGSTGQGVRLSRVVFADAANGWALSAQGASLLRSSDGGRSWSATTPPPMQLPQTLRVAGSKLVLVSGFVVTDYRGFRVPTTAVSEDGGTTWRVLGRATVDVVLDNGVLWSDAQRSVDAGRSFNPPVNWPSVTQGHVIGAAGVKLWAVVIADDTGPLQQRVGLSEDAGLTWQWWPVGLPPSAGFSRLDTLTLDSRGAGWGQSFLQTDSAWVWHTADWGRNWQAQAVPAGISRDAIGSLQFIDGQTAWLQTASGARITRDAGQSWSVVDLPPGIDSAPLLTRDRLGALLARSSDGLTAVRSLDDGRSWASLPGGLGADAAVNSFAFNDSQHGLALAADGLLLETSDSGLSWTARTRLGGKTASAGYLQAKAGLLWLVDSDGGLQRSRDTGRTWARVAVPSAGADPLITAHFFDAQNGLVTVNSCTGEIPMRTCDRWLHVTQDGGASWVKRRSPLGNNVGEMSFGSPVNGVRVVNNGSGAIDFTADGGGSWQPASSDSATGLSAARVVWANDSRAWLIGYSGTLWRSDDAGRSWRVVKVPAVQNPSAAQAAPTLRDLAFADALNGWMVGENGTVYATTDGGSNWAQQNIGTQQTLGAVYPVDAQHGWIGGSRGVVFGSLTGGR